jgi:hypothetical protein
MRRVVLALLACAASSWGQCPSSYAAQRSITVNGGQVTGTLTNFSMLVSNPTSGQADPNNLKTTANGGRVTGSNGYDIIFVDAGGALLPFELVGHGGAGTSYSASSGNAEFWVEVPSVATGSSIYMCYGNAAVTTYQGNDAGAWNAAVRGVWHFGTASSFASTDSTGLNGSTNHLVAAAAGKIGGGASFAAASSYLDLGTAAMNGTPMTFCGWLNQPSFGKYHSIFGSSVQMNGLESDQQITTGNIRLNKQNVAGIGNSTAAIALGGYSHLCLTYNASSGAYAYYVNGAPAGGGTTTAALTFGNLWLGASGDYDTGLPAGFWGGEMDEIQTYNAVQTAAWVEALYHNQNAPGSFYVVSGESAPTVAPASFSISPVSGNLNSVQTLTLTGTGTAWASGVGLFSITGGTGAIVGTATITSATTGTLTLTVGTAVGTLTITDTSTGKTATFQAGGSAGPAGCAVAGVGG